MRKREIEVNVDRLNNAGGVQLAPNPPVSRVTNFAIGIIT